MAQQDLQQIARWIEGVAARSGKSLSALFMSWDDNSDGYIDYEEFVTCCFTCQEQLYLADPTSLEYIYTREEFDELARTVDQVRQLRRRTRKSSSRHLALLPHSPFFDLFTAPHLGTGQDGTDQLSLVPWPLLRC